MKKKRLIHLLATFTFILMSFASMAIDQTYTANLTTPMFTDRDFELPDAIIKYEQHSEDIIEVEFFDNDTKVRITFSEDVTEEFIQTIMDDFELNWEQ